MSSQTVAELIKVYERSKTDGYIKNGINTKPIDSVNIDNNLNKIEQHLPTQAGNSILNCSVIDIQNIADIKIHCKNPTYSNMQCVNVHAIQILPVYIKNYDIYFMSIIHEHSIGFIHNVNINKKRLYIRKRKKLKLNKHYRYNNKKLASMNIPKDMLYKSTTVCKLLAFIMIIIYTYINMLKFPPFENASRNANTMHKQTQLLLNYNNEIDLYMQHQCLINDDQLKKTDIMIIKLSRTKLNIFNMFKRKLNVNLATGIVISTITILLSVMYIMIF